MYLANFIDPQILDISEKAPWFLISLVLFFVIIRSAKWVGVKFNNVHDILFNKEDGKVLQLINTQQEFVNSVKETNERVRGDVLVALEAIKNIEKKLSYMSSIGFENMNSEYFQVLFEQTPVPIAFVSGNMEIMRANEKCCELLGYNCDEIADVRVTDITAERDQKIDITQAEKIKAGELDFYRLEKTFVRKNGKSIYCTVYVYRIPTEGLFNHYIKVIIPKEGEFQIH